MSPRVAGNLVAVGNHSPDHLGPRFALIANHALTQIITRNEEGALSAIGCEHVEEVFSIGMRAIIPRQCDISRPVTVVDTDAVWDGPDVWTGHASCISARWLLLSVT